MSLLYHPDKLGDKSEEEKAQGNALFIKVLTYIHMYIIHTYICACMHAHIRACIQTCIHACILSYTHSLTS